MPPGGPPPKKGGAAKFVIAGLGGLVLITAIIVGAVVIFGGSHLDSVAHQHLPKGCEAVIRVDISGLMKVPAIKEHVVPAIDEHAKDSEDAGKLAAFLLTAQLNPKEDLKEIVVCVKNIDGGDEPDVLAIVGGHLLDKGIIGALDKHAKKGKFKKPVDEDGLIFVEGKEDEVFIGQVSDAALVVSNKKGLMKKAADTGDAYKEVYKIPLEEQIVAVIPKETVKGLSKQAGGPFKAKLKGAGRVVVSATLDPGKVGARLEMPSKSAAKELRDAINEFVDQMKQLPGGAAAAGMNPMAAAMLDDVKVKTKGKDLVVEIAIPDKYIEDFAKKVAEEIGEADEEI